MNEMVCLPERSGAKVIASGDPPGVASLVQTIFHEHWWLELACDGAFRESVVRSGGRVVGRLPYKECRRPFGLRTIEMPRLVHVLGPAIAPQFAGENFPRNLKEYSIITDLLAQLPRVPHISFRLHGGLTNTLAFEAAGFISSTAYTVEVAPDTREVLWRQMRDKTRNVIRRAEESLSVTISEDVDRFLAFYDSNLRDKGRQNEYENRTTKTLLKECLARGVGRILFASDKQGNLQASIFTMWDARQEYYFMSTRLMKSMNGATSLLIWEGIQHASSLGLVFDMDCLHVAAGSVPNLLLLTGFGGAVRPRYQVQKTSPGLHFARESLKLAKALTSKRQA